MLGLGKDQGQGVVGMVMPNEVFTIVEVRCVCFTHRNIYMAPGTSQTHCGCDDMDQTRG